MADALGWKIEVFQKKVDWYKLAKAHGFIGNWWKNTLLKIMGKKFGKMKSSSLQSLERGKPTEIDYINGFITTKAHEVGVTRPD